MIETLLTICSGVFLIAGIYLLLKYISQHHDKRVRIGALLIFLGMIINGISDPEKTLNSINLWLDQAAEH